MSGLSLSLQHRVDAFSFDVALNAPAGVTGIIGPSGAGKSMLLQMIAGLAHPDQGKVTFDGETLSDTATRSFLAPEQRRIGYVFQDALLFPHMSVAQNLDYGASRRATGPSVSRVESSTFLASGPCSIDVRIICRAARHNASRSVVRFSPRRAFC